MITKKMIVGGEFVDKEQKIDVIYPYNLQKLEKFQREVRMMLMLQ